MFTRLSSSRFCNELFGESKLLPPSETKQNGSEILFAAAPNKSPLTFTVLGKVWGPRNDAGYDDRAPNHNDFRAASVSVLRSAY